MIHELLEKAAEGRLQERERISAFFVPLAAALAALIGYVLLHLPALDSQAVLVIAISTVFFYIPVEGATRAWLRIYRRPALIPETEVEEAAHRRFEKLPEGYQSRLDAHAFSALAFILAALATWILALQQTDQWMRTFLYVNSVVFLAAPLGSMEWARRRRRKLKDRIRDAGARIVLVAIKWTRAAFVVGYVVAAAVIISDQFSANRESGAALAGTIGAVLLGLVLFRMWLALSLDTSYALIRDLQYRLSKGEITGDDAMRVLEYVEALRNEDRFFDGDSKEFVEMMRVRPTKPRA
jgi:hypothetical protein